MRGRQRAERDSGSIRDRPQAGQAKPGRAGLAAERGLAGRDGMLSRVFRLSPEWQRAEPGLAAGLADGLVIWLA